MVAKSVPWFPMAMLLLAVVFVSCLLPVCGRVVKVTDDADTKYARSDPRDVLSVNTRLRRLLNRLNEAPQSLEAKAEKWLTDYTAKYKLYTNLEESANWDYETNITTENSNKVEAVKTKVLEWSAKEEPIARQYYKELKQCKSDCKAANLTYALRVIVNTHSSGAPKDPKLRDELLHITTKMQTIYSVAAVKKPGQKTVYKLDPDLEKIMADSRDYNELLWAWVGWRNESGKKMRSDYDKFVKLENIGAKEIGYSDAGALLRMSNYMMDDELEQMADSLFLRVFPLYKQLHAYVRRKLIETYPGRGITDSGPIYAHLLGNMWAQQWHNIYNIVIPFPSVAPIDVTTTMIDQKYTAERMFKTAESFYVSIGLDPMTPIFWEKSMIVRPTDREVVCHGSAHDLFKTNDFRIKMCTKINQEDLTTIHHEMGHIEYFMQYSKQPPYFRSGANAAFHEAVGDTIALSVMTPGHLQTIGLPNKTDSSTETSDDVYKRDINFLLKMALEKIAFLPFGYMIDKYRWDVYRGNINEDNYNSKWWQYRLKYQGLKPPVSRSEEDFDPGAKYHIPAGVPYIRYFFSFIGQFQFHKALCDVAGHTEQLHKCDIYNSKAAGTKLKAALSLGTSKPWQDVMQVLTGQRDFSTSAIEEYFQPLVKWLEKENEGHTVGWEGEFDQQEKEEDDNEFSEWLQQRKRIVRLSESKDRHLRELLQTLMKMEEGD